MATAKNKGLKSPAVVAAAQSPAGQQALSVTAQTAANAAKEGVSLISFLVKSLLVVGVGWYAINTFKKRFIKMDQNTNYPAANITDGQAQGKANALYEAMYGISANFEIVATQIAGLNYNGWVKVYNAFGNRKGMNPFGNSMNLVEWLNDEFNEDKLNRLRFLVGGVFRQAPNLEHAAINQTFFSGKIAA